MDSQRQQSGGTLTFRPGLITKVLGVIAGVLVVLSFSLQVIYYTGNRTDLAWIVNYMDVNKEQNVPTYFSVALLFIAALLLLVVYLLEKQRKTFHSWMWALLAAGFLLLSMDELATFHEKLTYYVRLALNVKSRNILYVYGWVLPGILMVLLVVIFFMRFWLRLPKSIRTRIAIAALLYVGGAVGMEVVGGMYVAQFRDDNLMYNVLATVEESLEMAGAILFIDTLLRYLAQTYGELRVRILSAGRA